jgi:hypothetical protein
MAIVTLIDPQKIFTIVTDLGQERGRETETSMIVEKEDLDHHILEIGIETEIVIAEIVVEHQKEVFGTGLDHALPRAEEVRFFIDY